MGLTEDIAGLVRQEAVLTFARFTTETAWELGTTLRGLAIERGYGIVIDVRRFGAPHQQLFYAAVGATTPENGRWVARKAATVARFHKSSYHVGRLLAQAGQTIAERYSLPAGEYAAHGGCFPINVEGTGIVGGVTVSGLAQREDHNVVVEAIAMVTGRGYESLRLPPEQA